MRRIYLDSNGSTPALDAAKEAAQKSLLLLGNPSSFHEHGREVRAHIDRARDRVAKAVGAQEKQIIFTSGASESNRWFVDAILLLKKKYDRPLRILCSPFEHPSLLKPIIFAQEQKKLDISFFVCDNLGNLKLDRNDYEKFDCVICCQAHNETGIIPNINKIINYLPDDVILMSDISQSLARTDFANSRVDFASFSAQKMGGYAGMGGFFIRNRAQILRPPWQGGGQEQGFRPGTESVVLISAFGAAAEKIKISREKHHKLAKIRDFFELELKKIANIKIIGENISRLPNTSAISFLDQDPDGLRISCDLAGLSVGFGSACSGLAPVRSFALKQMGLSLEQEKQSIRFSLSPNISKQDITEVLNRLSNLVCNF